MVVSSSWLSLFFMFTRSLLRRYHLTKPKLTDDRIALRIRQLCKCRLHGLLKIPLFDVLKGLFCCFI